MPFYADLKFFRQIRDAQGGDHSLLVYAAKGHSLDSALKRIPLRRLESWKSESDAASWAALRFLAGKLDMPSGFMPKAGSKSLLYCHPPFELPGASRHWSFAMADTTSGMIWIGKNLDTSSAKYLAEEAFYQAANNQYNVSEKMEVDEKYHYLKIYAPNEPGLATLLALLHIQDRSQSGNPYSASSFEDGAVEQAIQLQAKAFEIHPDYCLGFARQARYYSILNNFPAARSNLEKASKCESSIQYLAAKAILHLNAEELDSCRRVVTRLEADTSPEKSFYPYEDIPLNLAKREGNWIEADKNYARLVLKDSHSPQTYGNFANYLVSKFRFDEAAVLCKKADELGQYPLGEKICLEVERKQKRYGDKQEFKRQTQKWEDRFHKVNSLQAIESEFAGESLGLDFLAAYAQNLQGQGKSEPALAQLNQALERNNSHTPSLRTRLSLFRSWGARGLAWTDFRNLARLEFSTNQDSIEMQGWLDTSKVDTAALSREPAYSMRCGFTRNILEAKAIDRPEWISLKAMGKRRIYLRMALSQVKGRTYNYTYTIKDGQGKIKETGDLSVSPKTEFYSQWISYRFGQPQEAPGFWSFYLYLNKELVVAQTLQVKP